MLFKEDGRDIWFMFNGEWVNTCFVIPPERYHNNHWTGSMYANELAPGEIAGLREAAEKGEGSFFTIRDRNFIIEAAGEFNHRATENEIIFRKFKPEGVAGDTNKDAKKCLFYRSYVTGPQGARYELLREEHHTQEDVRQAKAWLRRNFDVVDIKIIRERNLLKDEA